MKIPKMILFDYGQTLVAVQKMDPIKGTEAVLRYATRNRYHLSAKQVQARANEINEELGRSDPERCWFISRMVYRCDRSPVCGG